MSPSKVQIQRQNTRDHLPSEATLGLAFSARPISAAKAEEDCIKGKKGTQTVQNRLEFVQTAVQILGGKKKLLPRCSEPETSNFRAQPGFPAGGCVPREGRDTG